MIPKEKSINETEFLTIQALQERIDRYENWSRICIETYNTFRKSCYTFDLSPILSASLEDAADNLTLEQRGKT